MSKVTGIEILVYLDGDDNASVHTIDNEALLMIAVHAAINNGKDVGSAVEFLCEWGVRCGGLIDDDAEWMHYIGDHIFGIVTNLQEKLKLVVESKL
jgi:hypothetical protein